MQHHFDIRLAKRFGVLEAIILNNLQFWVSRNAANGVNFYDGAYWTYNSVKAFAELFPYASEKQIRTALKKLVDAGILQTGNYNKLAYDRTLWYAFTKYGLSICPIGKMEAPKKENGNAENGEPIPYVNTNNKPINKPNKESAKRFSAPSVEEVKAYCQERHNKIDPEQFVDFYESKGWRVGAQPMKDWKAAVRTWEKRDAERKAPPRQDTRGLDLTVEGELPF